MNNNDNKEKWIIWDGKFEIGYKRIDEQHKELVNIINDLYDASRDGNILNSEVKEKFKTVLKKAIDYATYHFDTEEKIMRAVRYKSFKEHMSKHREFSNKVLEETIKYANDKNMDMEDFIVYLRDWLFNHIVYEDKVFVDELKNILAVMEKEEEAKESKLNTK